MNKPVKWIVWLFVLMLISFMISGMFFMGSKFVNPQTGELNCEVLYEVENFMDGIFWINIDFGVDYSDENICEEVRANLYPTN